VLYFIAPHHYEEKAMNKKLNTILFILGATLCNILVTILTFLLLLVCYAKFIMPLLPPAANNWAFPLMFIASLAVSFIVYRYALRFLIKKIEIEKYFDPLFVRKHKSQE
jgi:membrane protein implicated in regulation of membrane protease activity